MDKYYAYVCFDVNNMEGSSTTNYCFVAYEPVDDDDIVVVDTRYGLSVGRISGFPTVQDVERDLNKHRPLREIVSVVDMKPFRTRQKNAQRMKELKKKMDARVNAAKQTAVYEMLSEKDPELKNMLVEYKQLKGDD